MYYIFMNTYTASSLLLLTYNRLEHVQGLGCNHLEAGRLVLWARQKLKQSSVNKVAPSWKGNRGFRNKSMCFKL